METVVKYLEMRGESVEDLAAKIGVAPSTLYRAIKGTTSLRGDTLLKIHAVTGIKVDILVRESQVGKGIEAPKETNHENQG